MSPFFRSNAAASVFAQAAEAGGRILTLGMGKPEIKDHPQGRATEVAPNVSPEGRNR
jgi:hypothetical protein